MANVLLLTYMFPPAGGIGTPRALAYVRYLPRPSCRISVLAPSKPALRDYDPELSKIVPRDVAVHRAWSPDIPMSMRDRIWRSKGVLSRSSAETGSTKWLVKPLRSLLSGVLFPDPQILWAISAFRKACWVVEHDEIDTLIVNMPPFSLLNLALRLKSRFSNLKVITDFRDEWIGYYLNRIDEPSGSKMSRARRLEARAVRASTYVSTVTETWAQRLRRRYPKEPRAKFICTPNGYDPALFRDFRPRPRKDGKIVLTYFGTLHNNKVYSPENYFAAIRALPEQIRSRIETRFIGRIIGSPDLPSQRDVNVRILGFLPKHEGIRRLEESDFLVVFASDASSHAGKLFDYLACGKPILALSPSGGEIDRLLQATGAGWCADPFDKNLIRQMILSACERFLAGRAATSCPDAVQRYAWPNIISRFAMSTKLERSEETGSMVGSRDLTNCNWVQ